MTDQLSLLMDYQPIELGSWMVTGIGGTSLPVHGQGSVRVITENDLERVISPVLHVPELGTNLFSIGSATEAGMKAVFTGTSVNILSPDGNTFVEGERADRTMYHLKIRSKVNIDHAAAAPSTGQRVSSEILHQRLGHVNFKNLKRMVTQLLVDGLNIFQVKEEEWKAFKETIYKCFGCAQGKMHKTSSNHSSTHIAQACGDRVHTDYCGPMSNASLVGGSPILWIIQR